MARLFSGQCRPFNDEVHPMRPNGDPSNEMRPGSSSSCPNTCEPSHPPSMISNIRNHDRLSYGVHQTKSVSYGDSPVVVPHALFRWANHSLWRDSTDKVKCISLMCDYHHNRW